VEIEFPIEFLVEGTPVSLQSKSAQHREDWKETVKKSSFRAIPSPHFATDDRLGITIFYFPEGQMQGDIDNIVKPILDALSKHIYLDDRQVERVVVQKFEAGNAEPTTPRTTILADAFDRHRPLIYIRISDDPLEEFG
jgi:crossover junction endodeoxyribonuclease RusA